MANINFENYRIENLQAFTDTQQTWSQENRAVFDESYGKLGMRETEGVAAEDYDADLAAESDLPEGVLSPQHINENAAQVGNLDANTGEKILPATKPERSEEPENDWWGDFKSDFAKEYIRQTAELGLTVFGAADDFRNHVLDTTADIATWLGAPEEDMVRGEKIVPQPKGVANQISRTLIGYGAQYYLGLKGLRASIGAPKTVMGKFGEAAAASAAADFMMDPRTDSLIDVTSQLFNQEVALVEAVNPRILYETDPVLARLVMATEGLAIGSVFEGAVRAGAATGKKVWGFTQRMINQADELESVGAERMRKSSHKINSGMDPEGLRGAVEFFTAKILKGAEAMTSDMRMELSSTGITGQQLDDAWTKAQEVVTIAEERSHTEAAKRQLANLSQGRPGFGDMAKNLTSDELEALTGAQADNLMKVWDQLDPDEMVNTALAGQAKKGWYRDSADALMRVFGPEDSKRFAGLLSALSPQTSVESNLRNALHTWKNWTAAGRPSAPDQILQIMAQSVEGGGTEKSVLGAWRKNAYRALTADDPGSIVLSGPKVQSFYKNLTGNLEEVTNDAWMANYAGIPQDLFGGITPKKATDSYGDVGVKSGGYLGMSARARQAATTLTEITGEQWSPAEVQETVWSYAKTLYEERAAQGYTGARATELAENLPEEKISETPDFGTLLETEEYGQPLKEAGYGPQLEKYAGEPGPGQAGKTGAPAGGVAPESESLGDVAARLDKLYAKRSIPKITSDLRKRVNLNASRPDARGDVPGPFTRGTRRTRTDYVNTPGYEHILEPETAARFENLGAANPKWIELDAGEQSANAFHQAISQAKEANPYGAQVFAYDKADYKDMKLFMTPEGDAGFAIKPDGDLVSVFSAGKQKFITPSLMTLAVQQGARKLDAFDTQLMAIYTEAGFRPVARMKWDDKYIPEGWDKQVYSRFNKGEPDVVFMVYDPDFDGTYKKGQPYVKSYNGGNQAQSRAEKKVKTAPFVKKGKK